MCRTDMAQRHLVQQVIARLQDKVLVPQVMARLQDRVLRNPGGSHRQLELVRGIRTDCNPSDMILEVLIGDMAHRVDRIPMKPKQNMYHIGKDRGILFQPDRVQWKVAVAFSLVRHRLNLLLFFR
jgi:hypothetical protein